MEGLDDTVRKQPRSQRLIHDREAAVRFRKRRHNTECRHAIHRPRSRFRNAVLVVKLPFHGTATFPRRSFSPHKKGLTRPMAIATGNFPFKGAPGTATG